MIVPTTLFEKSNLDAARRQPPELLCSQLVAMAHHGFHNAILIGMQSTAFASAAQFILHANAKGMQIDNAQFENILSQHVGPAASSPVSSNMIASYMSSAKMQHQIGARQLLADALDMASIAISADSAASAARDQWVRTSLHQLVGHAYTVGATMPMFAAEQRVAIDRLVSRYPTLAPAPFEQEDDFQDNEGASEYAPR